MASMTEGNYLNDLLKWEQEKHAADYVETE